MANARWGARFIPFACLGLAAGLRLYQVGGPALRGDEGFSARFVTQPLPALLSALSTGEPNPPLYWLVLRGWMQVAGDSELALRWPSVLAGLLTVALIYRLMRAWWGHTPAAWAMLFVALNPFLIWYAQDARAYALLTTLVLWAIERTWHALNEPQTGHWWQAGLLWWLALFTHYFAGLPLILLVVAGALTARTRRVAGRGLLLLAGIGLAYLPWALYVAPLLIGHSKGWIAPITAFDAFWRTVTVMSVGVGSAGATELLRWFGGGLASGLIALGGWVAWRLRSSATTWLLLFGPGVPLSLWLISLSRPVFVEQYFIFSLPCLIGLAALGLSRVRQPALKALLVVILSCVALASLKNYYFNDAYAKSHNWPGVMAYLEATQRANEVIVLNLPDPAFYYYYHGLSPVEASPTDALEHVGQPATIAQLERLRDRYDHIRFFFAPNVGYDPDGFVGEWLAMCCEKTSDTFVYKQRVQSFDTPRGALAARQTYGVEFADGINLTGYRVVNSTIAPGETIHLTLFWEAREPISHAYTVFVHLLAPDGFNLANADSPPRNGTAPTDHWRPTEPMVDPHPIQLTPDFPPGVYQIEIGLYRVDTEERLIGKLAEGALTDHIVLPVEITVVSP